jgi:hypothetical protein
VEAAIQVFHITENWPYTHQYYTRGIEQALSNIKLIINVAKMGKIGS